MKYAFQISKLLKFFIFLVLRLIRIFLTLMVFPKINYLINFNKLAAHYLIIFLKTHILKRV